MSALPDAEQLCAQLAEAIRPHLTPNTAMIGLHTGGVWLAERLHRVLPVAEPLGTLDIAFYRDDYHQQGLARDPKRSQIPFSMEGRDLLLIDDVLYTGRTVRAVINELFDFGRPASVMLAVLVDRGGRELPIEPAFAAARVSLPRGQRLALAKEGDRFTFSIQDTR